MWNCEHCGCQGIATPDFCPQCFTPRPGEAVESAPEVSGAEDAGPADEPEEPEA